MATIREIALKTGLAPGTVSRILNQDATLHVASATRKNVIKTVKELGYTKKVQLGEAHRKYTFGILEWYSPQQEQTDPYYLSIRKGAQEYIKQRGMHAICAFKTNQDYKNILKNVDCLLCIGKFTKNEIQEFQEICPTFIVVDMYIQRLECNTIVVDMPQAIEEILTYLYELGHRQIAFLGGKEYLTEHILYFDQRRSVFTTFCDAHGLSTHDMILEERYDQESGYKMMQKLLGRSLKKRPTAVFAASDSIAFGAMRAIGEYGLQIPKDLSIVGFNDIDAARFTAPPLTTIKAPSKQLGEYAARFLEYLLDSLASSLLPVRIALPCSIQYRQSCAPPYTQNK